MGSRNIPEGAPGPKATVKQLKEEQMERLRRVWRKRKTKALFYRYFFQHARFITSGKESRTPGTLADVSVSGGMDTGFLAFLRFIGVVYFQKRNSAFTHATPESHFNSYVH